MQKTPLIALTASALLLAATTASAANYRPIYTPLDATGAPPVGPPPAVRWVPPSGPPQLPSYAAPPSVQPRYVPRLVGAPPSGPPPQISAYAAPPARTFSPPVATGPSRDTLSFSDVVVGTVIAWGLWKAVTALGGGGEIAGSGGNPIVRMMEAQMDSD